MNSLRAEAMILYSLQSVAKCFVLSYLIIFFKLRCLIIFFFCLLPQIQKILCHTQSTRIMWCQRTKGRWVCSVLRLTQESTEELDYDRNSATLHHVAPGNIKNSGQWSTSLISVLGKMRGRTFLLS